MSDVRNFIISLVASLVAAVIVLFVDRLRFPRLIIIGNNEANVILFKDGTRWKSIRVSILNERMPFPLRRLPRQTAENCQATISFSNEANEHIFSMKGRWTDTPELPFMEQGERIVKVLYPDSVSIREGDKQVLDIAVMKEGDREAFGWNNKAYLHSWKTPEYKLPKGQYNVKIEIVTQNGRSFTKTVKLQIGEDIPNSFFRQN